MKSLEELKEFFSHDRYATATTGIEILEAGDGYAKVGLSVNEGHKNAGNRVMGAVYYTMADFAFAVAENCVLDSDMVTVTQTAQINFLRPWTGGKVTCKADIVKDGRAICLYEIKVFDKEEKELALIIVNGFKTARK